MRKNVMNTRIVITCLCCLFGTIAVARSATVRDEEFLGPFPTWYDLKKDFGAVGDGKADDTTALQKALDSVGTPELKRNAIWVPTRLAPYRRSQRGRVNRNPNLDEKLLFELYPILAEGGEGDQRKDQLQRARRGDSPHGRGGRGFRGRGRSRIWR